MVGDTTKKEFIKGYTKLVSDVVLGNASSRTLNKPEDIEKYFSEWDSADRPAKKRGKFVPSDIIEGGGTSRQKCEPKDPPKKKRASPQSNTVLPKDFHVRFGADRLKDIRRELAKLKRAEYPNAGSVLLRVFLELAITDYLKRIGEYDKIVASLKAKNKLGPKGPTMRDLAPTIVRIAKSRMSGTEATTVEKALRHDPAAPFSLSYLHAFVHQNTELPGERDILQFWLRTEPLFRLMLEEDDQESGGTS